MNCSVLNCYEIYCASIFQCISYLIQHLYYSSVIVRIIFLSIIFQFGALQHLYYSSIYMAADIGMADRPHDDPDYMEVAIRNMIDDGSQYFIDYHEIMQGNPTEQQEGNALECSKLKI